MGSHRRPDVSSVHSLVPICLQEAQGSMFFLLQSIRGSAPGQQAESSQCQKHPTASALIPQAYLSKR